VKVTTHGQADGLAVRQGRGGIVTDTLMTPGAAGPTR
jgi:hypothetical protein